MAFETTICEECPTPIHWKLLRQHYLFLINQSLDARDAKLKEQSQRIEELQLMLKVLQDEVRAWRKHDETHYCQGDMLDRLASGELRLQAIKAMEITDATKALREP